MAAIEKLLVEIFERKKRIIENLKHQKQIYDQNLLSKLIIQGISPPPWLLNSDFQASTSNLTEVNKAELISGLWLPRPGPLVSYPSGPCFLYDKPIIKAANSIIPDELCAVNCTSSNGNDEDGHVASLLCHADGAEDTIGIASSSHVDGFVDTSSYVPMSPEERTGTRLSGVCNNIELSLVSIQRSKPRQKALELRNSAKTSGKSRLGVGDVGCFSGRKTCRSVEQLDGLRESCELVEPFALAAEMYTDKVIASGNNLEKERSADACGHSLLQSTGSKKKAFQSEESEMEKNSSIDRGRDRGYRSYSQQHNDIDHSEFSSESRKLMQPAGLQTEICSNEAAVVGNCSDKEISTYASVDMLVKSTGSKVKEAKPKISEMENQSSLEEHGILRSGNTRQGESGNLQNTRCRTYSNQSDNDGHAIANSNCYSGIITKSNIGGAEEAETKNQGRRSGNDVSYKPIQLDFDDEEVNFGNIANCLSGTISLDTPEKRIEADNIKNAYSLPCAFYAERNPKDDLLSSACEALEVPDSEGAHVSFKRSEKTLLLPHTSLDFGATEIGQLSSAKISASSQVPVTDFPSVGTGDTVQSVQSVEKMEASSPSKYAALQTSTFSSHGEAGGSKLHELGVEPNMLSDFCFSHAMNGSWPCHKRRKIEHKNANMSAGPIMKLNPFHADYENIANRTAECEKERNPSMSRNSTISNISNAALSTCAKETDRSVNVSSSKEHMLSLQVQCPEDEISLGSIVYGNDEIGLGSIVKAVACEPQNSFKADSPNLNQSAVAEPLDSLPQDRNVKTNATSADFCNGRESHISVNDKAVFDGGSVVKLVDTKLCDSLVDTKLCGSLVDDQALMDGSTVVKLLDTKLSVDQRKSSQKVDEVKFSIGSPLMEYMNVAEANQIMPEFEGFLISKKADNSENASVEFAHEDTPFKSNIMDRTSLPEKFCYTTTLSTPVSPFLPACKLYLAPGIYSSVPNELLENYDRERNMLSSPGAFLKKSHSDLFSFHMKKPFLSPFGKGMEGITSKSGGSGKLGNSNPELTCFPILEDPESSEEDADDAVDTSVKTTASTSIHSSTREPLHDVSVQNKSSLAPDCAFEKENLEFMNTNVKTIDSISRSGRKKDTLTDISEMQNTSKQNGLDQHRSRLTTSSPQRGPLHENSVQNNVLDCALGRGSMESVSQDIKRVYSSTRNRSTKEPLYDISEMQNDGKKSGLGEHRSRMTRSGKVNNGFSVGTNSSKKHSNAPSSQFRKPKLSGKSSLRSRGQSLSQKKQKHNNIVSNIKSFVPLVQQKQAASVIPEKRDVKVKALQAAEAAKQAAEKREMERKQKKEAMKLERARIEQENIKEMELKKKLKEEERKKREAENAAKKRQR
ncbi:unnamed protein product, partial [Amaranthus hypochondriacus]